jgi:hypothetical protein
MGLLTCTNVLALKAKIYWGYQFLQRAATKENPCKGLTTHSETLSLPSHSTRPAKEVLKEPQPK